MTSSTTSPTVRALHPVATLPKGNFFRESYIVFHRQIRMNLRNPAWVLIGVMQPVLYLVLFGPLLKPLVASFPGGSENAPTPSWCPACWCSWVCSARCSPASA